MSGRLPSSGDVEDFQRRSRAALEAALRADDPDITDDEVAAVLDRAGSASIVAARVRDQRQTTRRTGALHVSADHYETTPEGLAALRRDLLGGPGGAPSGCGVTYAELVEKIRTYPGDPTQQAIAAIPGMPGERAAPGLRSLARESRPVSRGGRTQDQSAEAKCTPHPVPVVGTGNGVP